MDKRKYFIDDINLGHIRNRNETRVIELIPRVLYEFPDYSPSSFDLEDIYARTLSNLPPRYKQTVGITLREEVTNDMICEKIRESIAAVQKNPQVRP